MNHTALFYIEWMEIAQIYSGSIFSLSQTSTAQGSKSNRMKFSEVIIAVGALASLTQAVFFKLPPYGPNSKECFNMNVTDAKSYLLGKYEAVGEQDGVRFTVQHSPGIPSGGDQNLREVHAISASSARIEIPMPGIGWVRCCFKPTVTTDQTVTFSLRVGDKPLGLEYAYDAEAGFLAGGDVKDAPVNEDHVDRVEQLIRSIRYRVDDLLSMQEATITRGVVHRDIAEHTNSRLMHWSVAVGASIVCLAAAQVYYLKSYFETRTVV
jgi:hypothetical protein